MALRDPDETRAANSTLALFCPIYLKTRIPGAVLVSFAS